MKGRWRLTNALKFLLLIKKKKPFHWYPAAHFSNVLALQTAAPGHLQTVSSLKVKKRLPCAWDSEQRSTEVTLPMQTPCMSPSLSVTSPSTTSWGGLSWSQLALALHHASPPETLAGGDSSVILKAPPTMFSSSDGQSELKPWDQMAVEVNQGRTELWLSELPLDLGPASKHAFAFGQPPFPSSPPFHCCQCFYSSLWAKSLLIRTWSLGPCGILFGHCCS